MIVLDYRNILDYTELPMEYIFIDSAEIDPGKSGIAKSNISMQDWYFRFHFPGDPIVPGTMLMEMVLELGTLTICTMPKKEKKRVVFRKSENVSLNGFVRPGDQLVIYTNILRYKRGVASFEGKIKKEESIILYMNYELIIPDEMIAIPQNGEGTEQKVIVLILLCATFCMFFFKGNRRWTLWQ